MSEKLGKIVTISTKSSSCKISLFGAHVLSWKCKGEERLFLSKKAVMDGSVKAIRRRIPLVFPQFGQPSKSLPSYGFARISMWNVLEKKESDSKSTVVFVLKPGSIARVITISSTRFRTEVSCMFNGNESVHLT